MSGTKIAVDTNVIINQFNGNQQEELLLNGNIIFISAITVAELFSSELTKLEMEYLQGYISNVNVIHTNDEIINIAAALRKVNGLKLPDAIIAATAIYLKIPLATADKAFQKIKNIIVLDYQV